MCSSVFGIGPTIMDKLNYQLGGDLTDIVRASSGGGAAYGGTTSSSSEADPHHHHHHWHFSPSSSDLPIINNLSSVLEDPVNMSGSNNSFGDPFSSMRDPFLHDHEMPTSASSHYFNAVTSSAEMNNITSGGVLEEAAASFCRSGGDTNNSPVFGHQKSILEDDVRITRPCKNIFSNMIQISPNNAKLPVSPAAAAAAAMAVNSPRPIKPSAVVPGSMINASTSKDCLVDNTGGVGGGGGGGVQISSPRNPGLKRRKNQAKKVVCIPAPAAASSRQTGEVVPSDLWAWRKYGQKPIKGSPYPRGYYRCSSSKGCSARKQVERSRTDPNMLVITYTSEHNHPWPTQRNALAGSTRSQPSRNNSNAASSKNNNSETQKGTTTTTTKPKEEEMRNSNNNNNSSDGNGNMSSPVTNSASVKEEMEMEHLEKQLDQFENNMDQDGSDQFSDGGIPAYKPSMMENQSHEDFFAELGELEADPLDLLFTQAGFNDQHRESKASDLDPFHLFDWSGDHNTNSNTTSSFEDEPNKRRL